jgi:hypothetical protein
VHLRRIRSLFVVPAAVTALAVAASVGAASLAVPASAADEGGVAWTVQTADNDNGTGRGSFSYDADPGTSVSDTLLVTNTGTLPLPLAVYAADAFTTPSGDIDLLTDPEASTGAGSWVRVETQELTLEPGARVEVPFTITIPADAAPGDHAAGIVTSLVTQDSSQALSVDRRLGARINIRVSGELAPAAEIGGLRTSYAPSWNPFAPGILTVDYSLNNAGNTRLTGIDTVSAAGPAGLLATATTAQQLREVVPGSALVIRREVPVVSLGWLTGTVEIMPEAVGLGAAPIAPVVAEFSAPAVPWSLLALLVLVAALVVGTLLLVRHRRRRGAAGSGTQGQQG